ncbi:MAG: hypothetical protein A2Y07_04555 [Planctomycetes bacterium GWF2_50_10]|nr:MAG: hypothetical protein A2Y07_04555 [Planctomycetes bacterium GWF2_50_10]
MEFPDCTKIKSNTIRIVPRYNETDKAGIVHNSVYSIYWELARTELLRANGLAYSDLEKSGVFFVVAELGVKFRRPATYDEPCLITATCSEVTAAKVVHQYRMIREADQILIAEGFTMLACVDTAGKIRRVPEFMYPSEEENLKS